MPAEARPWLLSLAAIAVVVGLVLARPYDGALDRDAATGTQWTEHLVRAETALARAEGRGGPLGWMVTADQGFPPLIHWVAVPLGDALGRDAGTVGRFGILWLLLLAGATGVLAARAASDPVAGATAAALVATFPAIHGTALGYAYDLPMTALLFAAAATLLAGGESRPVAAGVGAGALFVLACLGKWTALVLAPPLVLGVLACRADDRRRRGLAAAVAAGVGALGVGAFLAVSSRSLRAMAGTGYDVAQDGSGGFRDAVGRVLLEGGGPLGEALVFLPVRAALGAIGPALTVLVVLACGVWLVRSRAGLGLVTAVIVGDVLLIHRLFPALNDRWLISIVPVLAVAAAAGVAALPGPRLRAGAAAALVGLGLAGTWDFHHGTTHAVDGEDHADWNDLRAWSAASSTEPHLGWARADYTEGDYFENREQVWAAVIRCGARDVLLEEPGLVQAGDAPWWRYRDILNRLDTAAPLRHIATLDGVEMTAPAPEGRAVALLRHDRREQDPPSATLLPGWTLRAVVPAFRSSPAVGLWTPAGSAVCGAFDP